MRSSSPGQYAIRFARSVAILAGGTAVAQAISVLASPILTRLYSPAEFGVYQVFLALVASVARAASLGYETTVVLPTEEGAGEKLLGVAVHSSLAFALVVAVFLLFFGGWTLRVLDAPDLAGWVFLAPFQLVLMASVLSLNHFSIRLKRYDLMAKAKMAQALFLVAVSIGLGLIGATFWGLILGLVAGWLATCAFLLYPNRDHLTFEAVRLDRQSRALAWRYREFPFFAAPGRLLNGMVLEMPVFFLSHFFPSTIVGYFSLVVRVADAPLGVLASSVSQVSLRNVVDLVQRGDSVRTYLLRLSVVLGAISMVPAILLMSLAPAMFVWLFGPQWREAGHYLRILLPFFAVKFVVSTLIPTLGATENTRLALVGQATSFIAIGLVFLTFGPKEDPTLLLTAFAVTGVALYLFHFLLIWVGAGRPRNKRA